MRNLLLTISFDGGAYHGWQVQENAVTVQQVFQDAWQQICGKRENITGCSRTDAGVHANMYCCNIRTESEKDCNKLLMSLNAVLPDDIAVKKIEPVSMDFHARYDCKSKEYIYRILNSPVKNPFEYKHSLKYPRPIDEKFLNEQAKQFTGTYDFTAFCSSGSSTADTVRTVYDCGVERDGDMITVRMSANGFLYNMVRITVGTLLYVSEGKIEPDKIKEIILSKDRNRAGITVRPEGLYLNKVTY